MNLFKVYFSEGKAHSPELMEIKNFHVDRICTKTGELKWLIVIAESKEKAIMQAEKGYEAIDTSRYKSTRGYLKVHW
ncbi:hypothetical protein AY601_0708 [Pedobacter cryoconitis]|uniref:Uncharacterized protein n=1 Tax=Pedobacter cryoconitis TaxID=188932 RepID=A0A127V8S5_9SPHI|nr:hypothetical protein [Pedobacter cryoconitis]AMP97655.1 hypothetical protein AY601_0708 [Pedobacter cryoconitis]